MVVRPFAPQAGLLRDLERTTVERTTGFEPATLTLAINRACLSYLAKYK